jgi:hypothetical protein
MTKQHRAGRRRIHLLALALCLAGATDALQAEETATVVASPAAAAGQEQGDKAAGVQASTATGTSTAGEAAAEKPAETPLAAPGRHHRHRAGTSGVESRVALLTAELKLTATQQQAVRKILEDQRQQVARAWSDSTVPSAFRVKATQAIADHTADQIRALLSEEQRARYVKPRQKPADNDSTSAEVEKWMSAPGRTR